MSNLSSFWRITFNVGRWLTMVALLVVFLPILITLLMIVFMLIPKGRIWSNFWGHSLAEAARGVWHWFFGPPKVRIHYPYHRSGPNRRRRFTYWRG